MSENGDSSECLVIVNAFVVFLVGQYSTEKGSAHDISTRIKLDL